MDGHNPQKYKKFCFENKYGQQNLLGKQERNVLLPKLVNLDEEALADGVDRIMTHDGYPHPNPRDL